ncbi:MULTISPECIES: HesA/MoeB/ThiF family protein [unclassified Paracoccus (in: a-proteobacteria)]|uniref:HesA/MoeB/ThiF family protein n=1 Tax=unclassified Paracoccus (in: a-proteobacteria) TaxID=2688777 RepID=UPI0015FFDBF5|nr:MULTISPECIES: HesA/MoeB/ThiF family protein [unclassified Paracoccus (in: a-proteobacteria)]MBB1492673.1 HesA/MoeB/ThiF family protein [Paracoccus sp. MC1854]MBB1499198.1 HesA/MoeB/ThiF family protein [Paracoccus sp. MC1862]QQO45013.1 HesA/MoeB/ThiF family protein [Paracoccus sp. MC1862]
MILPEVGEAGQARLRGARLLVVGAGGLGSPAIMYLAGAGVGALTIVDPDVVETTNLHRQPIHAGRVGWNKADSARAFVAALDPGVSVTPVLQMLRPANAAALVAGMDVVLDCGDSFAMSYILSDACMAAGVPLISASALGLTGYCGGFCGGTPSLRAVFPDLPERAATCATAGVLGPIVGMLGTTQAQMALAVLLGLEHSPLGQLVTLGTGLRWGGFRFDGAPEPEGGFRFIDTSDIREGDFVLELRGEDEAPTPVHPAALRADPAAPPQPPEGTRAVIACRSGLRAWRAARILAASHPDIVLIATGDR